MRTKLFAIVLAIPFLMGNQGGCEPGAELVIPELPQRLQHCLPDPLKGKKVVKLNQRQIAHILASYKTAHADCEAKVNEIRALYAMWKSQTGN